MKATLSSVRHAGAGRLHDISYAFKHYFVQPCHSTHHLYLMTEVSHHTVNQNTSLLLKNLLVILLLSSGVELVGNLCI